MIPSHTGYKEQAHHYVPRAYFKPWANLERKVIVYERKGGRILPPYLQSTRKICVQPGLYAYSAAVIPERRNVLEEGMFQKIDSDAAKVLNLLNSCTDISEISESDLGSFGLFLVSLRIRTPEFFQGIAASAEFRLRKLILEAEKDPAAQDLLEEFKGRSFVEIAEEYFRPALENKGYESLMQGLISGRFMEPIWGMNCSVVDVKKFGMTLLTSDRPLVTKWENNRLEMMTIPISPQRAFVAFAKEDDLDRVVRKDKRSFAELSNISVIQQAKTKAFASDKNHSIRFFERRLGKSYSILPFSFPVDPELLDRRIAEEQYLEEQERRKLIVEAIRCARSIKK